MKILPLLAAPLLLLSASCQSLSEGLVSLEGRAIVFDDQSADTPFDVNLNSDDVEVESYGAHVAVSTPLVDVLGGIDFREYEGEDATEVTLGARRRIFEFSRLHPYVEANLRYSVDTDEEAVDDYFGWNAGFGALLDLTDSLFLNARLVYETTDNDGNDIDGVLGTLGIGFHL